MLQTCNYVLGTSLATFHSLAPSLEQLLLKKKKKKLSPHFTEWETMAQKSKATRPGFPAISHRNSFSPSVGLALSSAIFPMPHIPPSLLHQLAFRSPHSGGESKSLLINNLKGCGINLTLERLASGSGLLTP